MLTEQEIKEKIAFQYHQKFKRIIPDRPDDPERDWRYAENVYHHYTNPRQDNPIWNQDDIGYQEFGGYFDG